MDGSFLGTEEDGDFERLGTATLVRHPCALSVSVGWVGGTRREPSGALASWGCLNTDFK